MNSEAIAHEVIGGVVWECLSAGSASAGVLSETMARATGTDAAALHEPLDRFRIELAREGLLAETDRTPDRAVWKDVAMAEAFQATVLRKYTDLEALIALDPIHDVVADGWPNARTDQS